MAGKEPEKKSRKREPEPAELQAHIDKALALSDKTDTAGMYKAAKFLFDPQFIHAERLDTDRPSLFVTNHGNWGWEGGVLPSAIHELTGKLPRLLSDSAIMMSSMSDRLMDLGMVLANRTVCSALMDAGESILVFPGGAREGAKRRGEQYKLFWEGRTGFVRMAIEHGFTITPVATIGPDEMWDIRWDSEDMQGTWVETLLKKAFPEEEYDPELVPPIPKGLFGTLIPRPERIYLAFGEPYDTAPYAGRENDKKTLNRIKGIVQGRLEELIKDALLERSRRRDGMHWLRRRLTRY